MPVEPRHALLTERVAVVTGAAMGIGRAIAEAFVAFGARVAACDRAGDELESLDVPLRSVLDVRDAEAVDAFFAEVAGQLGPIDVVVNNAAGTFRSPFLDVSPKGQQALVDENFTSVTNVIRSAVPRMAEAGGSIINLTSIEAHRAGPGFAVYAAMKAAVANLTQTLALELADRGIRVNCIAPDEISTPGVGALADGDLGMRGSADDVAGVAAFLAGDLSRFVTGTTVHVDGGNLAAAGWRRDAGGQWRP